MCGVVRYGCGFLARSAVLFVHLSKPTEPDDPPTPLAPLADNSHPSALLRWTLSDSVLCKIAFR